MIFLKFLFALLTPKIQIIYENIIIIFFENKIFTLSSSSSSSIYNIVIAINTPTTLNNQFKALNAPKNRFRLLLSHFLWTKNNISFTFSLYSSKKIQDFDSKILKVHRTIQAHDSCSLTSRLLWWWSIVLLEKLNKLSHSLKLWNQIFFPEMSVRRLLCKSSPMWRLTRKSSGQCIG